MQYAQTCQATFINRPNRFIAQCQIGKKEVTAHVKNTGRCKELFVPGAQLILNYVPAPNRKTDYDVVAVIKNNRLINIDSQIPNAVVLEALHTKQLILPQMEQLTMIKSEVVYGKSRLDFYLESEKRTMYMEVKGVTLEENGIVLFPDAPTQRGIKHIYELIHAVQNGYEACLFFLVQMNQIQYFTPNMKTHPEFGEALKKAAHQGVQLLCYDSIVTSDSIQIGKPVPIFL